MTLKNSSAPLLCCFKLCASFRSHWWIQASYSPETPNLGQNGWVFLSRMTLKFDRWPWKTIGHLFYANSSFVHHFKTISKLKLQVTVRNSGQNQRFFCPVWPWNLTDDLKQSKSEGFDNCDRPSNLAQIWSKSLIFSARVTLKFDGWPRKIIGHIFYTTSSFVHHFKSINEFKLKLQSESAQFRSKWAIFCPVWPWNLMDDLGKQ